MANRYWVGGTGTWNLTSTTNWSATSGGAAGASVPTAADSVFFDQAATYTVTMTSTITCLDFTVSAGAVTFVTGTSPSISVHGSLSFVAATVWNVGPQITFRATTAGKTITTNGVVLSSVVFNGTGGVWTLGSAITTLTDITVSSGEFNTSASSFSVNATALILVGSGGSITLNASTVSLSAAGTALSRSATTVNAGTSQINLTSTSANFLGGGATYYNVAFTNTLATSRSITGANTFNNLSFAARTNGFLSVSFSDAQTINGTFSIAAGADATQRTSLISSVFGVARVLTCAAVSFTDVDFRDITIAGAAAPASGVRLGDAKGNSGITFAAPKTVYWNLAGAQNWSAAAWATVSGGAPSINNFPLAQDTAVFDNAGSVTDVITIDASWNIGSLNMSGRTAAMTLATGTTSPAIVGNWSNGTGVSLTGTGVLRFIGQATQTILSNGVVFSQSLNLLSVGGTVRLLDACTTSAAAAGAVTLTNGTLDLNGKTLTLSAATTATFLTTAGTKNITFNGGSLVIAASGATAFNNQSPTGFTTTAGTGTGSISLTSASAKTFVGGSATFACSLNQGGNGPLTISGTNTFNNITNTFSATSASTITLANDQSVFDFTASGAAGRVLSLNSSAGGVPRTLTKLGGGFISGVDYLNIRDIVGSPQSDTWYIGSNSTYVTTASNSARYLYPTQRALNAIFVLTDASGTWTVPSDWANNSNSIHLFGGGGGSSGSTTAGGGNRAGGAGGGGGGYTKITNFSTSKGASISYVVGSAGAAGVAGGATSTAGNGGSTTFNAGAFLAGGGGGGVSDATVQSSIGGAGGSGSTFNGGSGGAGGVNAASNPNSGGGGGGAGGPNGVGGSGGIGITASTGTNLGAGGGGGNGGGTNGGAGTASTGGAGGNNFAGIGGGSASTVDGTPGFDGGGGSGGGGAGRDGGLGGSGVDVFVGAGGGGGGAGGSTNKANTAVTGLYGGGAGGSGNAANTMYAGAPGQQGGIVIVYTPYTASATLLMFM